MSLEDLKRRLAALEAKVHRQTYVADNGNQLKPCPFCGGTAVRDISYHGYEWMACANCGARGPGRSHDPSATGGAEEAWNYRQSVTFDNLDSLNRS